MQGDSHVESSHNLAGPLQIDGPVAGDDLGYWLSRGVGYALLGGTLLFAVGSLFVF